MNSKTVNLFRGLSCRFGQEMHCDDAYALNGLICQNSRQFSAEFMDDWHLAYQTFCADHSTSIILSTEDVLKFSDIKAGMVLHCIGGYADCIHKGTDYKVKLFQDRLTIQCDAGNHDLETTTTANGELPEFEIKSTK